MFGSGAGEAVADEMAVRFLGRLPLEAAVAAAGESGNPFILDTDSSAVRDALKQIAGNTAAAVSVQTSSG